jgi:hypothetical protein
MLDHTKSIRFYYDCVLFCQKYNLAASNRVKHCIVPDITIGRWTSGCDNAELLQLGPTRKHKVYLSQDSHVSVAQHC